MLIRAWNLYSGNTVPRGRRAYLREMIELIAGDGSGIACLQEVPAWALERVGDWVGMQAVSARTRRPKLGFVAVPGGVGHRISVIHAGRARSGPGGQGNVILFPKGAKVVQVKQITLNTNVFCEEQAVKLGLTPKQARLWERERRVCQLARLELGDGRHLVVANVHATSWPSDLRLPNAELRRAAAFVDRAAELRDTVILAGDFNTTLEASDTLRELTTRRDDCYSAPGPWIDHVLVRGAEPSAIRVWADEERMLDGKLLSDHAPVELELWGAPRPAPAPPPAPAAPVQAPPPLPVVEEPQPVSAAEAPKADDDRWETGSERWETGGGRWEEE